LLIGPPTEALKHGIEARRLAPSDAHSHFCVGDVDRGQKEGRFRVLRRGQEELPGEANQSNDNGP
jgi:hypothetical protein